MSDTTRSDMERLEILLAGHLYQELTSSEEAEFQAFLASDPAFASEVESHRKMLAALPRIVAPEPPQAVVDEVLRESRRHLDAIRKRHESPFWGRFWLGLRPVMAMSAAAAITLVVGYYAVEHATEPDAPGSRQRMERELAPVPATPTSAAEQGVPRLEAVPGAEPAAAPGEAGRFDEMKKSTKSDQEGKVDEAEAPAAAPAAARAAVSRATDATQVLGGEALGKGPSEQARTKGYKSLDTVLVGANDGAGTARGLVDAKGERAGVVGVMKEQNLESDSKWSDSGSANAPAGMGYQMERAGTGGAGSGQNEAVAGSGNTDDRQAAPNKAVAVEAQDAGSLPVPASNQAPASSEAPASNQAPASPKLSSSDQSVTTQPPAPAGPPANTAEDAVAVDSAGVQEESWVHRRQTSEGVVQQAYEKPAGPAEDEAKSRESEPSVASPTSAKPEVTETQQKTSATEKKSEEQKPAKSKDTASGGGTQPDCASAFSKVVNMVNQGQFVEAETALKALENSPCATTLSKGKRDLVRARIDLGQGQRDKAKARLKSLENDPESGPEAEILLDAVEP